MELIELREPELRRGVSVEVRHTVTSLSRGLDHGEQVVVRSADGEYHAAAVSGLDFKPEDTVYTLTIGSRLPAELVAERLTGVNLSPDHEGVHEVVDMLGQVERRPQAKRV
jgi:hypothetical protein